jgi:nitrogen fixation protein FixH
VKRIALLLFIARLLFAADREGNFKIRFEPTAKLQTRVEVPFEVHVNDAHGKPLPINANVQLTIAPPGRAPEGSVKAWYVQPGVFIAKPQFPTDGQWTVTVTARRGDETTQRTINFIVSE